MARRSLAAVALLLVAACGHGRAALRAEETLRLAHSATNAARDSFLAWDKSQQDAIVGKATSLEGGQTKLVIYRAQRQEVLAAFTASYVALSTAAAALPLVRLGKMPVAELVVTVIEVVDQAKRLHAAIKRLGASP